MSVDNLLSRKLSLRCRPEKELLYRLRSPSSDGDGGGVSSSSAVNGCGIKLSLRELGRGTPEELRVEPGRGEDGMS